MCHFELEEGKQSWINDKHIRMMVLEWEWGLVKWEIKKILLFLKLWRTQGFDKEIMEKIRRQKNKNIYILALGEKEEEIKYKKQQHK